MSTIPAPRQAEPSVTGVRMITDRDAPPRYEAGQKISPRFKLLRKLGSGGMGTVWVAHHLVLDIQVAIKLIDLSASQHAQALGERLLDEARSVARLDHPSIVRVHDFGITAQGDPFIAMELLQGDDLATFLQREQHLPAVDACQLLLPIAHAVMAAHDRGVIHRDLKPENIFLSFDAEGACQPKLLDFGVARMVDNPRRLTLDGFMLGTPYYMAPELIRGRTAEYAADIWAFCVVLYELVTGVCPFNGPTYVHLVQAIAEQAPRSFADHGIDEPELWSIVERGLNKDPARRWGSMRELGQALAIFLKGRGIDEDILGTSLQRAWFREPSRSGNTSTESGVYSALSQSRAKFSLPIDETPSDRKPVNSGLREAQPTLSSSQAQSRAETGKLSLRPPETPEIARSRNRRQWRIVSFCALVSLCVTVLVLERAGVITLSALF